MPVFVFVLVTAAVAFATAAVVSGVRRYRRVCRQLTAARTAHRLAEGCLLRDMQAFQARVEAAAAERAVVREAGRIVEAELVLQSPSQPRIDPMEGGPSDHRF